MFEALPNFDDLWPQALFLPRLCVVWAVYIHGGNNMTKTGGTPRNGAGSPLRVILGLSFMYAVGSV